MEDLIKKVYKEKMEDGTFETIVAKKFEEMISASCDDLFKWNGVVKKQMEEKIKGIMGGLIESTDFSEYVTKLQTVINETIKGTSLGNYKEIAESIQAICGQQEYKFQETIKLSTIFEKYVKWIEDQFDENVFEEAEIDTDEGTKNAYVTCSIDYEKSRHKISIVLGNEKVEEHENTEIRFNLVKSFSDEEEYYLDLDTDFKISDLRHLPSFLVYLLNIKQQYVHIIFDEADLETELTAEFEFEW